MPGNVGNHTRRCARHMGNPTTTHITVASRRYGTGR